MCGNSVVVANHIKQIPIKKTFQENLEIHTDINKTGFSRTYKFNRK